MIEQRKADYSMATQRVLALVNTTLGFFEEHRAEAPLAERQSMVFRRHARKDRGRRTRHRYSALRHRHARQSVARSFHNKQEKEANSTASRRAATSCAQWSPIRR